MSWSADSPQRRVAQVVKQAGEQHRGFLRTGKLPKAEQISTHDLIAASSLLTPETLRFHVRELPRLRVEQALDAGSKQAVLDQAVKFQTQREMSVGLGVALDVAQNALADTPVVR
ncbi:MAG: hypothetical protein JRH20_21950, partial [Deltaproteobacteria bacterium]|nr:hypothetical protein [Deltaproteobacteria bacterium]